MTTSDREARSIVLNRVFSAPPELVFLAWTEPRHLERWWGPDGFTTVYRQHEFRPGGRAVFDMTGPDGTVYPNLLVYTEIDPPRRIAYDHSDGNADGSNAFKVTVDFTDVGGRTEVRMEMLFPSPEARAFVVGFGAIELGYQTLGHLESYLNELGQVAKGGN